MTRAAAKPAGVCAPAGTLAQPPLGRWLCRCGVELHPVPAVGVNDWTYVTDAGDAARDDRPAGLVADPAKWWAELARDRIGEYSNLSAAITLGCWSWWHYHQPQTRVTRACTPLDVPVCCEQPMWASPNGWMCRRFKTLFCYQPEL